jgi:hypothetical protein
MKRLWLGCFVLATAWLATVVILTAVARFEDPPGPPQSQNGDLIATEQLDGLNIGGWLLLIGLPAAIVVVSTAYYLQRRYFAKPS